MTNYRIRDFDFEFDAGDLLEYETPTLSPYIQRSPRMESYVLVDGFVPGSTVTPSTKFDCILLRVAHLLIASQQINMPMSEVALMGFPDAPGEDQNTKNLAFNRAADVREILKKKMNRITAGSADKVTFSIYVNNAPGAKFTRAVDVRLPATCQTFFADYDQQSFGHVVLGMEANPAITPEKRAERTNNRFFVGQELEWRIKARANRALALDILPAQTKPVGPASMAYVRPMVDDLSAMQLELFKKYHPKSPDFDADSLMSCMLKFANGQLRSPHRDFDKGENVGRKNFGVGEPDSYHVFMFAEFALLCIDWKIPTARSWEKALPAMVAAQEVFMHVYRKNPKSPPPPVEPSQVECSRPNTPVARPTHPLSKFGAGNFAQTDNQTTGKGQSDSARLALITDKYKKMTSTDRLRCAMASNLLRAQTLI